MTMMAIPLLLLVVGTPASIPDLLGAYEVIARDIVLGQGSETHAKDPSPYCFTFLDKRLTSKVIASLITRVRDANPRTHTRQDCPDTGLVFSIDVASPAPSGRIHIGQTYIGRHYTQPTTQIGESGHVTLTLVREHGQWKIVERRGDWIE